MAWLWWLLGILLAFFALYLFLIAPRRLHRPDASALAPRLYAHRGLHDGNQTVAENGLPAFQKAIDAGYGIELDVQLSRDGVLMVFHDESLKRVCGVDRPLRELTREELAHIPLPDGSAIPTFREVLALVKGQVPLIVEVKYHGSVTANAASAWEHLREYQGPYCVESFHPLAMRYFRQHAPQVLRGQLAAGGKYHKGGETGFAAWFAMKYLLVNVVSRPHFVAYDVHTDRNLSMALMKHAFHPLLAAWTVRDEKTLAYARKAYQMPIFERFLPKD